MALDKMVKIIPLGGLGEIGKNTMAICCGNDIILVDAGLAFPSDDLIGVELVLPDISFHLRFLPLSKFSTSLPISNTNSSAGTSWGKIMPRMDISGPASILPSLPMVVTTITRPSCDKCLRSSTVS